MAMGLDRICRFKTGAVMQCSHLQNLGAQGRGDWQTDWLAQRSQHNAVNCSADVDGVVAAQVVRQSHQSGFECFEGDGAIGSQQHGIA